MSNPVPTYIKGKLKVDSLQMPVEELSFTNLEVEGDAKIGGDTDLTGDLAVGGDMEVTGTAKISGIATFEDEVAFEEPFGIGSISGSVSPQIDLTAGAAALTEDNDFYFVYKIKGHATNVLTLGFPAGRIFAVTVATTAAKLKNAAADDAVTATANKTAMYYIDGDDKIVRLTPDA